VNLFSNREKEGAQATLTAALAPPEAQENAKGEGNFCGNALKSLGYNAILNMKRLL
jgi:hypothetical protein